MVQASGRDSDMKTGNWSWMTATDYKACRTILKRGCDIWGVVKYF